MKINKQVIQIGGSQGIILPLSLMKHLELEIGNKITIQDKKGKHGKYIAIWKKNTK